MSIRRYRIRCWIPVEPDEEEYYATSEEAQRVLEHYRLLQPENIYRIEEAEGSDADEDAE